MCVLQVKGHKHTHTVPEKEILKAEDETLLALLY